MRRRSPGLTDELELGQPFDHRTWESRTLLGEHNEEVWCDIVGLTPDELAANQDAGTI